MNAKQYTIRNIHPKLDSIIRSRATRTGHSLNTVVLDALQAGLDINDSDLKSPQSTPQGLTIFDAAPKKASPFDPKKSLKELYNESLQEKYTK